MLHVVQCCDGIASLLPKKADSDRDREPTTEDLTPLGRLCPFIPYLTRHWPKSRLLGSLTRAGVCGARAELKGCHHRIYYFGNHFQKQ